MINDDAEVTVPNQRNGNDKKIPLINLITIIYFTNHQQRQLVDFLKKYPYKKLP